jgi:tetratricopeptide (TPR) repeat protein
MRWCSFVLILALVLAASPVSGESPDELIRRANAAFLHGDAEVAESLYKSAEERTGDPGLVAFNQAAALFQQGDYYAAEVHYARTLDDRACPPDRAAKAWFNRGTCLVRRGGAAAIYRSAIACFDRCLDSNAADEPLKADARHNLELAKLLWAEANKKAAKPDNPNLPTREEEKPEPPQSPKSDPGQENNGEADTGKKETRPAPAPGTNPVLKDGAEGGNRVPADVPNPQALLDENTPQKLSEEETREYLRRTEQRLRDERRRMLRILYGPDRPGIRDW